jgi:hypothetical protein
VYGVQCVLLGKWIRCTIGQQEDEVDDGTSIKLLLKEGRTLGSASTKVTLNLSAISKLV